MFNTNTDREWEQLGGADPYFGVLTSEKYNNTNLTDETKVDFFRTGEEYINNVMENIRKYLDVTYTPKKAIDFGCGVGRLVIPLAKVAEHVIGVDVSESMLKEAKKNCETRSIKNVSFIKSDDRLSALEGKYDFINSFIVFQHIPVKRGERIFENLIAHMEERGVCVVHFTYAKLDSTLKNLVYWVRTHIPLASNFINIIRGRNWFAPQMQINPYNINRLLLLIQRNSICDFYAQYTNHGGHLGILLFFRKSGK